MLASLLLFANPYTPIITRSAAVAHQQDDRSSVIAGLVNESDMKPAEKINQPADRMRHSVLIVLFRLSLQRMQVNIEEVLAVDLAGLECGHQEQEVFCLVTLEGNRA